MLADIVAALPTRRGHFLLESGYHSEFWLSLDALFVDPRAVAPLVAALADRIQPHAVTGVCGPLLGGAFLAQALATTLGVGFYYTQPRPGAGDPGLFRTQYQLPSVLQPRARGQRLAVVDDVISAGSSVRATVAAAEAAGATTAVVAALVVLGDEALRHFGDRQVPLEALQRHEFVLWKPGDCPHCRAGLPLEDPCDPVSRPEPPAPR